MSETSSPAGIRGAGDGPSIRRFLSDIVTLVKSWFRQLGASEAVRLNLSVKPAKVMKRPYS